VHELDPLLGEFHDARHMRPQQDPDEDLGDDVETVHDAIAHGDVLHVIHDTVARPHDEEESEDRELEAVDCQLPFRPKNKHIQDGRDEKTVKDECYRASGVSLYGTRLSQIPEV